MKNFCISALFAMSLFGSVNAADQRWANQITLEDNGAWAAALLDKSKVGIVGAFPPFDPRVSSYYTVIINSDLGANPPINVALGAIEDGKETALIVRSHGNVVATIDMDGTVHAEGADPKFLAKAIYMLSRDIARSGSVDGYQQFLQKMPEMGDLK